jgi:uncharacterized protein (DUF983 family)
MESDRPDMVQGQPSIAAAALSGLCPRCGARSLFDGPVRFAAKCRDCKLEFSRFNVGDGPAAILILLIGGLVAGLAIWLQLAFDPPYWLQAAIWAPVTLALVIGGLRISKAALLASEFRNRSGEGRLRK